jgi:hypothetical protein
MESTLAQDSGMCTAEHEARELCEGRGGHIPSSQASTKKKTARTQPWYSRYHCQEEVRHGLARKGKGGKREGTKRQGRSISRGSYSLQRGH